MKKETTPVIIKGFKGYDKNLKCREFQYKVGEEYETKKAEICKTGFHFCENPLDIFGYYVPAESRFTEVEGSGEVSKKADDGDTKVAVSKIKIGVEISLHSIIENGIKFIFERTKLTKSKTNTKEKLQSTNDEVSGAASNSGDRGAASNSGYSGAASNSGDSGAASNSGVRGAASNSGDRGAASNSGVSGAASNSGDRGAASNSGDRGAASNSGDSGAASNSGYRGAASNSGYSGAASNSGVSGAAFSIGSYSSAETNAEKSIAVAVGYENKAKGNIGSWLVIAERNDDVDILSVISVKVDGKKVKADTWYKNVNNKIVAA